MRSLKLFLCGLILLFISSVSADAISLYMITPCLLLPWVVYISIQLGYKHCLTFTFVLGIANDLLNPQLLGFITILLVLLSHFTHKYNNNFNKDKYGSILFSLFVINLLFYLIQWTYFSFSYHDPLYLLQKTLITVVYNTVVSCVVVFVLFLVDKLRISIQD